MKYLSKITNDVILCDEMSVKDYREILKSIIGDEVKQYVFIENFVAILSKVTNKPKKYIKELSIVDLIYLLFDIYANSIGACKITITNEEKTVNVELDLTKLKGMLYNHKHYFNSVINATSFKIHIEPPSLNRIMQPTKFAFLDFVKGIETSVYIPIKTNAEAAELIEKLPPRIANEIASTYENIYNTFSKINFLSIYNIDYADLCVFPNIDSLLQTAKLLFGDTTHLSHFYENFFHLCRTGNLNANFLESISVGEFNYFIGLLQKTLQPKESSDENSTEHSVGINENQFN